MGVELPHPAGALTRLMPALASRADEPLEEGHAFVKEIDAEPSRMAGLVGLGVGAQPTFAQANGRPALHRDRPSANARAGLWVSRGRRRGTLGDR